MKKKSPDERIEHKSNTIHQHLRRNLGLIRCYLKMEMDSLSDVRRQRVPEVRMAEGSLKGTEKFTVETKYIFAIIVQSCSTRLL